MGHYKCHKQPDIELKSDTSVQPIAETPQPLPMILKNCEYILSTSVVETRKKCRQLKVEGSVTNGKAIIVIEGETLREFEFQNTPQFSLTEDLKKGDKVVFLYEGEAAIINMKAEIVKK